MQSWGSFATSGLRFSSAVVTKPHPTHALPVRGMTDLQAWATMKLVNLERNQSDVQVWQKMTKRRKFDKHKKKNYFRSLPYTQSSRLWDEMDIYNLAILTVQALPQHFDPALKFFLYFLFVKQFLNFPLHMRRTFFFPRCAVTGSIQLHNRITSTKNTIIFICKKIQPFLS